MIARSCVLVSACAVATPLTCSARFPHRGALGFDAGYQVIPRLDKRHGTVVLQPRRQRIDVDACFGEAGQNSLAVASIRCEQLANVAVVSERLERVLRHGVDSEGCRESLYIKRVECLWILGAGTSPKQALRPGAGVGGALKALRSEELQIRFIGTLSDGNAESVGQFARGLSANRDILATDKERCH